MDALDQCHRQEFLARAAGMCNFEKDELSKCLHFTRVEDSKARIMESRAKNKAWQARRKQTEEEEFGKNGYLRKVVEVEADLRK